MNYTDIWINRKYNYYIKLIKYISIRDIDSK